MKSILTSKKGESIVELLVAILITGMAGASMAVMLSTSINLNMQAEDSDKLFYQEMNSAELAEIRTDASMLNQELTIEVNGKTTTFEINIYGKEEEKAMLAFGSK